MADRTPVLTFPFLNSVRIAGDLATGVTLGLLKGANAITGVATNQSLRANQEETIWDVGDNWTPMPTAGATLYIASTSASDTNVKVKVGYLNSLGVFANKDITTNGQTRVQVDTDVDFFEIASVISGGAAPVGALHIWHTGTSTAGVPDDTTQIQGLIKIANGVTHNGFFKVPANTYGVGLNMSFFVGKNADFSPHLLIRDGDDSTIQKRMDFPVYQTSQQFDLKNLLLSPNTVAELRGSSSVNNSLVTAVFQTLLLGEDFVNADDVTLQSFLW